MDATASQQSEHTENVRVTQQQIDGAMAAGLHRLMAGCKTMRGMAVETFVCDYMPRSFGFGAMATWARLLEIGRAQGFTIERDLARNRVTIRRGVSSPASAPAAQPTPAPPTAASAKASIRVNPAPSAPQQPAPAPKSNAPQSAVSTIIDLLKKDKEQEQQQHKAKAFLSNLSGLSAPPVITPAPAPEPVPVPGAVAAEAQALHRLLPDLCATRCVQIVRARRDKTAKDDPAIIAVLARAYKAEHKGATTEDAIAHVRKELGLSE